MPCPLRPEPQLLIKKVSPGQGKMHFRREERAWGLHIPGNYPFRVWVNV